MRLSRLWPLWLVLVCACALLAWAMFAPLSGAAREEVFAIPKGTWERRMAGDKRDISVLFDDEFYDLTLHAVRYETIRTAEGRRQALLVTPRMDQKPRGLFKRGGQARVWLDKNPPHLPIRFEVQTKAGTAVALLTEHHAPEIGSTHVAGLD